MRGAATLAAALRDHREEAFLFRELATLVKDVPLGQKSVDELRWRGGHRTAFTAMAERLGAPGLIDRVPRWLD